MDGEKKIETLEQEVKLMKGELKQSLSSVRDYLLNMELPSSEFSTILAALGGDGSQKITMKGNFTNGKDGDKTATEEIEEPEEKTAEEFAENESESISEGENSPGPDDSVETSEETLPENELGSEELGDEQLSNEELNDENENTMPAEDSISESEDDNGQNEQNEDDESVAPESEMSAEEEPQMPYDRISTELNQSVPKVNLMANLINWVSRAKNEIGFDHIPTFLEVYGISGHLSTEMKDIIMHLAEIASDEPEQPTTAEIWSQSMLALHGILTGGDAPAYALKPSWKGSNSNGQLPIEEIKTEDIEVAKPKRSPMKLKLIFPDGDGQDKEFSLDLTSDDNKES
jgi:hypothetical protein